MCEIALLSLISDLYFPISAPLSSPLLSSPLPCSLEHTPCGAGWWIPGFPKHTCRGSFLWGLITPLTQRHTRKYTHENTQHAYADSYNCYATVWCHQDSMLCPTVRPTTRLKKSCITTSNFQSEIGCLCVLSHLLLFSVLWHTSAVYLLSFALFSCSMFLKHYLLND